tara:strand:+ start:308 stop:481 length:174 start_codon:yes stop_codon:yes gene_type:complete
LKIIKNKYKIMIIDKTKIIYTKPRMICTGCGKENCGGDCWLINRIVKYIHGIIKICI